MSSYKQQYKDTMVQKYGEPTTLDELFDTIRLTLEDQNPNKENGLFVVGFAWNISYRHTISNTHSCPINGETNWGCKVHLSRGYPGFTGRVWIRFNHDQQFGWTEDLFNHSLSYPGTGGGGAYSGPWNNICHRRWKTYGHSKHSSFPEPKVYSWDYKIFADDFPLIVDTWTKNNLLNVIKTNDAGIKIVSKLEWNDPATKELDDAFLTWANDETNTADFRSVSYA